MCDTFGGSGFVSISVAKSVNCHRSYLIPHFSFEYSANLESRIDLRKMCAFILAEALETGFFEIGAVRVRGVRCDVYAIADQLPENGFVDLSLRLGAGRSEADKKIIGNAIFTALEKFLEASLGTEHFALSFEIREINPLFSWKRNSIHPRLRKCQESVR